jgi:hypothetical protein
MYSTSLEEPIRQPSWARQALGAALRTMWALVCLPVLAVLIVLEPIVCGLLWLFSALGLLGAFFYEFLVKDPRFPFWLTIGISIGLAFLAGTYQMLIQFLGGIKT